MVLFCFILALWGACALSGKERTDVTPPTGTSSFLTAHSSELRPVPLHQTHHQLQMLFLSRLILLRDLDQQVFGSSEDSATFMVSQT